MFPQGALHRGRGLKLGVAEKPVRRIGRGVRDGPNGLELANAPTMSQHPRGFGEGTIVQIIRRSCPTVNGL